MTKPQPCPTFPVGDPDVPSARVRLHCVLSGQRHKRTTRDGRHHLAVLNGQTHRWTDAEVALDARR